MSTTTAPSKPSSFTPPPASPEHQATTKVANRLTELCSTGKNLDALKELYADNARHVEVMDAPWCARIIEGKQNLLQKAEQFHKATPVHSASWNCSAFCSRFCLPSM